MKTTLLPQEACEEAKTWVEAFDGTPEEAYEACPRADWLLWLVASLGLKKEATLGACACAEYAFEFVREEDKLAVAWAIDAARRFANGETDLEEVEAARSASDAAAAYAAASASAASAAYAAYAAAYAAASASAASAAYAAYAAASRTKVLAEMADLVRELAPWESVAERLAL